MKIYFGSMVAQRLAEDPEPAKGTAVEAGVRGKSHFLDGGIYLLRDANSKAIIRCTDFRARPSHADQLHVDLWWRGKTLPAMPGHICTAGKAIWRNGLARTLGA